MAIPLRTAAIALGLALLLSLECQVQRNQQERTPPKEGASWVGGADGGAWVLLQRRDSLVYAEVYHEDGSLWESGLFRASNSQRGYQEIEGSLSSYDGWRIHLQFHGEYLEPVAGPPWSKHDSTENRH